MPHSPRCHGEHLCPHHAAEKSILVTSVEQLRLLSPSQRSAGDSTWCWGSCSTGGRQQGSCAEPPTPMGFSLCPPPPVLCTERAVRITKTYHDIDAVTNLLDEVRHSLLRARGARGCAGGPGGLQEWGQIGDRVPADTELPPPAERAGPGAGGAHRAVPAEAEPEPDGAQRAAGGAAGAGQRGGTGPWARSAALAPLCPRPCPDVPSPPPRSRSCATRSPCGTICSTSTPPPRRRASPPRPPPRREWVPAPLPTPWGFFGVGGWRNWVWGPADGVGG